MLAESDRQEDRFGVGDGVIVATELDEVEIRGRRKAAVMAAEVAEAFAAALVAV